MKTTSALLCIVMTALTGCAATPKPQLTDKQAKDLAFSLHAVKRCGETGQIPADVAAYGISHLQRSLASYSYDAVTFNAYLAENSNRTFYNKDCNTVAMHIHQAKDKAASQKEQAEYTAQTYKELGNMMNPPTSRTYCYQVGAQTLCSTQ